MSVNVSIQIPHYAFTHAESQIVAAAAGPGSIEEPATCSWNLFIDFLMNQP